MPSSDPNAVNFAGLKPEESKSLSERSAEPHEEPIIKSLKELYTCKPQSVRRPLDHIRACALIPSFFGYVEYI